MSEREKEIISKIAAGLSDLSEFDKGYFLGVVEGKASDKEKENEKLAEYSTGKEG